MDERPHGTNPLAREEGALANLPSPEVSAELTKLRDRLSFYESFDQVIQDNVSRAGGLLREAVSMREDAQQRLASAESETLKQRTQDRLVYRSVFSGLLDEVTTLQGQLERLARRVADALDDLEAELPLGPLPSELFGAVTVPAPSLPAGVDPEPAFGQPATELEIVSRASDDADEPLELVSEPRPAGPDDVSDTDGIADRDSAAPGGSVDETEHHVWADDGGDISPLADALALDPAEQIAQPEAPLFNEPFTGVDLAVDDVSLSLMEDSEAESETSQPEADVVDRDSTAVEGVEPEQGDAPAVPLFPLDDVAPPVTAEDLDAMEPERLVVVPDEEANSPGAAGPFGAPKAMTAEVDNPVEVEMELDQGAALDLEEQAHDAGVVDAIASGSPVDGSVPAAAERFPAVAEAMAQADEVREQEPGHDAPIDAAPPTQSENDLVGLPPDASPAMTAGPIQTTVLAHGVPRATTALSLKRFLEGLPHVVSVEPREYAEGILRLQVTASPPISIDDVRSWPDSPGVSDVVVREDWVEFELSP